MLFRSPFIVHWPGHVEGGRNSGDFFSTVDFVATLGSLCGVRVDPGAGLDHADALASATAGPRNAIFAEHYSQDKSADAASRLMAIKSIRTDRWKLNVYLNDRSELYDLEGDPHELTNLIDRLNYEGVRRDLGNQIVAWLRETDDPLVDWTAQVVTNLA